MDRMGLDRIARLVKSNKIEDSQADYPRKESELDLRILAEMNRTRPKIKPLPLQKNFEPLPQHNDNVTCLAYF